jgi:hypothetical protein
MHPRFMLPAVALLSLLVGIAAGWRAPRFSHNPSSDFPEEPWGAGQSVLTIRTDPGLDSPAAVSVAGELPVGRRWIFSFRNRDDAQRASGAARDAVTVEHRRALDWP